MILSWFTFSFLYAAATYYSQSLSLFLGFFLVLEELETLPEVRKFYNNRQPVTHPVKKIKNKKPTRITKFCPGLGRCTVLAISLSLSAIEPPYPPDCLARLRCAPWVRNDVSATWSSITKYRLRLGLLVLRVKRLAFFKLVIFEVLFSTSLLLNWSTKMRNYLSRIG